jgi:hypothetical protein
MQIKDVLYMKHELIELCLFFYVSDNLEKEDYGKHEPLESHV